MRDGVSAAVSVVTARSELVGAELLGRQYHTMRERILSLAADLDRIERAAGGQEAMADPRVRDLLDCVRIVLAGEGGKADRAERVQTRLSDRSPRPGM